MTGPAIHTQEAQWAIFNWDDMQGVANGTTTDFTINPSSVIWPELAYDLTLAPTNRPDVLKYAVPGNYDPDTNLFYVLLPLAAHPTPYSAIPVIAVFHVAQ